MKILAKLLYLFALINTLCAQRGYGDEGDNPIKQPTSLQFKQSWWAGQVRLQAEVTEKASSKTWHELRILQDGVKIFTFDPGTLYAHSVFTLDNGNLATVWTEGIGNEHHLFVFAYANGKIVQVLHAQSNGLAPEFVYQTTGTIMQTRSKAEKSGQSIGAYQQRIINPNTDWIITKGRKFRELLPVSADIYTWNEKDRKYKVRKNIPWARRLQNL